MARGGGADAREASGDNVGVMTNRGRETRSFINSWLINTGLLRTMEFNLRVKANAPRLDADTPKYSWSDGTGSLGNSRKTDFVLLYLQDADLAGHPAGTTIQRIVIWQALPW